MLKSILKFSVSNIVNMIIGILAAVILTRVFAPETYGVLNIFNTTVGTGLSIVYLGLDSSYIRFYNEPPDNNTSRQLGTKLLLICLLTNTAAGLIITVFFSDLLTGRLFGFTSRLICGLIFVSIFSQIILRFLNIKYRMDFNTKAYTIQAILLQVMLKLFVIVAALMSVGVETVVMINVLGVFALAVMFIIIQRKSFFSFDNVLSFSGFGTLFKFAVFCAPMSICLNLNNSLSQHLIVKDLGIASVGVYSSAFYFVTVFNALKGGFANFWGAYMYANYKEKQEEIKKVNEYLLLAVIVTLAGMILFKDIVYLLIGKQYHSSKAFFSLVLCYPMLDLAGETTAYGINIRNKNHLLFISYVVSSAVNLTLAYLLIPYIGLKGAALATLISGIILYAMKTVMGQRLYCSVSDIKTTAADIAVIIAMCIIPAVCDALISNILVALLTVTALVINRKRIVIMFGMLRDMLAKNKKKSE